MYLWRVLGVWIIPKLLILTPGPIAILFGWFLELPKNRPNLDPRTPYLLPKMHQQIPATNVGASLKNIIFISENLKFWNSWKVCIPNFSSFQSFGFWKLKMCDFECWTFEVARFCFWNVTMWKLGHMEIDNLKIGNLENEILEHLSLSNFVKMGTRKWWRARWNNLRALGYEFHIYQKTWNGHFDNFCIFK